MTTQLVPLQVRIGLKDGGRGHAYPDFNQLQVVRDSRMDWSHYVDANGNMGWCYDKKAGHSDADDANGSPAGIWLGVLCVDPVFAAQAAATFPSDCTVLDEVTWEKFYDERSMAHRQPEIFEDADVLSAIASRRTLAADDAARKAIDQEAGVVAALDPDNPVPGRRRNPTKTWAQVKAAKAIEIVGITQ